MTSPYLLVSYTKAYQVKVKSETFEKLNWHTMCQKYKRTISFYEQLYKFLAYVCCEKSTSKIIFRMPCHLLTNSTMSVLFVLTLFDTEFHFVFFFIDMILQRKGNFDFKYPKGSRFTLYISEIQNSVSEYFKVKKSQLRISLKHIAHPSSFSTNNYDTFLIFKKIRRNFKINLQNRK